MCWRDQLSIGAFCFHSQKERVLYIIIATDSAADTGRNMKNKDELPDAPCFSSSGVVSELNSSVLVPSLQL